VKGKNDATSEKLQTLLEDKAGDRINHTTVDRMLKKLDITKKKRSKLMRKKLNESRRGE